MQAFIHNDKVCIKARYEDREIMKSLGDYKWNKSLTAWEYPLSKLPKLVEYLNLTYGEEVRYALIKEIDLEDERKEKIASVNEIKKGLPEDPAFLPKELNYDKLYSYQKQALIAGSTFDSYALFMETGTGKTLVAIRLIELRKVPTLIVCPLSTIESVWVEELKKWSPDLSYCNLWDNMKRWGNFIPMKKRSRVKGLVPPDEYYDTYIINFESFKKIARPEEHFKFIIIDESSKLKAPKTQITKKVVSLRNKVPYRLIMSGLPAPNNLLEYWGQMAFISEKLLGDNFFRFRNIYFKGGGFGGFQYFPKRGSKETIMKKVGEQAFFIKKTECLDLPDRVFEIRQINLDTIQLQVYNEMLKQNIIEFKNHTTLAMNELAKIMKLRQITSGFTITTEGLAVNVSDTKFRVLFDFLKDELPQDEQAIIWCQFHWEIETLWKLLNDKGETSARLYGEISQQDKDFNIKQFQNKKVRFLIAHPKSGGMGLTFTNCSYMIWFSISYSQEEHAQANDRIYRIGQENKCTYIYILAKDTIDEIIYKALKKKQNLAESCLNMLKGSDEKT